MQKHLWLPNYTHLTGGLNMKGVDERRTAELRGPCALPFTLAAVQQMGMAPLPLVWRRNMLAALIRYGKTNTAEAPKAAHIVAHSVWHLLYRYVQVPQPGYAAKIQTTTSPKPSAQPNGGPLGAYFRCGVYGHWATSCVTQPLTSQRMPIRATAIPGSGLHCYCNNCC